MADEVIDRKILQVERRADAEGTGRVRTTVSSRPLRPRAEGEKVWQPERCPSTSPSALKRLPTAVALGHWDGSGRFRIWFPNASPLSQAEWRQQTEFGTVALVLCPDSVWFNGSTRRNGGPNYQIFRSRKMAKTQRIKTKQSIPVTR